MAETRERIPVDQGNSYVNAAVVVNPASDMVVIATHPWGPMGGSFHDPHPGTVVKIFSEAGK